MCDSGCVPDTYLVLWPSLGLQFQSESKQAFTLQAMAFTNTSMAGDLISIDVDPSPSDSQMVAAAQTLAFTRTSILPSRLEDERHGPRAPPGDLPSSPTRGLSPSGGLQSLAFNSNPTSGLPTSGGLPSASSYDRGIDPLVANDAWAQFRPASAPSVGTIHLAQHLDQAGLSPMSASQRRESSNGARPKRSKSRTGGAHARVVADSGSDREAARKLPSTVDLLGDDAPLALPSSIPMATAPPILSNTTMAPDPAAALTFGDFTRHFDEFQNGFASSMLQQVSSRCSTLVQGVAQDLSTRLEQRIETRHQESLAHAQTLFNATRDELQATTDRMSRHDADMRACQDQIRRMQLELVDMRSTLVTQSEDRAIPDPSYDRAVDHTILKLNGSSDMSQQSVATAIRDVWFRGAFTPDQWKLECEGSSPSRYFTVRFVSTGEAAARMANRARGLLKNQDGTWRKIFCNDADGASVQLYIQKDQSPKQRRLAIAAKRIERAIESRHPALTDKVHWQRPVRKQDKSMQVMLSVSKVDCIRIKADDPDEDVVVDWDHEAVSRLGLDKASIMSTFRASFHSAAAVDTSTWCP